MANHPSMDGDVDDIRRRTWAPFVGAALAALTAGSLVVFSLVAQRTSLDGFPELRIGAPTEAASGRPASITVAPLGGNTIATRASDDDADATGLSDGTGAAPLTLIPLVPATTPSTPVELANLDGRVSSPLSAARNARADGEVDFDGRFRADGVLLASIRNGEAKEPGPSPSATGKDGRHVGKHAHKSRDAKGKRHKNAKRSGAGRSGGRRSTDGSSYRGKPSFAGSSSGGSHGASSAPRPQPSPQGPPAHSNAGGNGKSHRKGHKKH